MTPAQRHGLVRRSNLTFGHKVILYAMIEGVAMTRMDLEQATGMSRHNFWRRLPELQRMGLVFTERLSPRPHEHIFHDEGMIAFARSQGFLTTYPAKQRMDA